MMKRNRKYIHSSQFIMLVVFCLILGSVLVRPVHATERTGSCGENLTWTLSGEILTISGTGEMTDYADGALAPWYGLAPTIKTLNLSSEMTSIGDYAFWGCSNVTNLTIPERVKDIGKCAFAQCKELLHVNFGTGLEIIGEGAFQECSSLPSVSFPDSLKEIGGKAFFKCINLSEVNVPSAINVLGESAFSYCTGIRKAIIDASITELPGWIFYGCSSLEEVYLAEGIATAGDYAFLFCDNLTGIISEGDEKTIESLHSTIYGKDGAPKEGLVKRVELPEKEIIGEIEVQNEAIDGFAIEEESDTLSEPTYVPYDSGDDELDLETVDSNPETSNLTDAEGTTYYISKRSSKWGITLKQFSVYVALWIASAVLIVAVIMLTANQRKKSKEQYEELVKQGEAEDAAAEEALQLEIMKEMLNKKE